MSENVAGVILAGGRSRRMGADKTGLCVGKQSMLERVVDCLKPQTRWLVVSINDGNRLGGAFGLPVAVDAGTRFGGPLFGILSGLKWARSNTDAEWVVSIPVDTPFLPDDLVHRLYVARAPDAEIAVARSSRLHPIIALWPISVAEALEIWLANSSQRAARTWLETLRWSAVDFGGSSGIDPFFNVNTPEDLALAREHAGKFIT